MPKSPEKAFQDRTLKRLREIGGVWFATPRSRFTKSGISDVIGCFRGQFYALEFKAPGGKYKVTPTQEAFLRDVNRNGGGGFAITTETIADMFVTLIASKNVVTH